MNSRLRYHCYLFVMFTLGILLTGCWSTLSYEPTRNRDDNSIWDLALQGDFLWLCGPDRLDRLNLIDNTIEKFADSDFVSCRHLLIAKNGWVWVYRNAVRFFDGERWRDPQVYFSGRSSGDYRLTETNDGSIWIASTLLSRYDSQTDQTTIVIPELPEPTPTPGPPQTGWFITEPSPGYIGPVFESDDGALWLNEQFEGLMRWDRKSDTKQRWEVNEDFNDFPPLPTKFLQGHDGTIYVGTVKGAYQLQDGRWVSMASYDRGEQELGYVRVEDILEDSQGKIWVAYSREGVKVWDGATWRDIGNLAHATDTASAIFETSSGEIWIGFNTRGTFKYENGSTKEYSTEIQTFIETPDHRLFGGGRKGLFLYNRKLNQWELYPVQ